MARRAKISPAQTAQRLVAIKLMVRKLLKAIEPWYDWGTINVFRLDSLSTDFSDEAEGSVHYFEVQWLGLHFGVQIGRTPRRRQP